MIPAHVKESISRALGKERPATPLSTDCRFTEIALGLLSRLGRGVQRCSFATISLARSAARGESFTLTILNPGLALLVADSTSRMVLRSASHVMASFMARTSKIDEPRFVLTAGFGRQAVALMAYAEVAQSSGGTP